MAIQKREDFVRAFDLAGLRRNLDLTQTEMAARMCLSMRACQDREAAPERDKPRHSKLAEYVALEVALERKNPMLAPGSVRAMALDLDLDLAQMLRGS